MNVEAIKPGPKPKKQDGTLDKRRRDNKSTPGNKPSLKPSKPSKSTNNKHQPIILTDDFRIQGVVETVLPI
jgi:hypothetical protein